MQLTDEQLNIVQHHQGAAIVYAVAGAGKSTTMAHRVQHLVQVHGVPASRILVCSFSKATVNDIEHKLEKLSVPSVSCYTFNALGRKIVQKTIQQGYWPAFNEEHIEHRNSQLAMRALVELGKQYGKNFSQLDINQEDLQNYISVCKGNLRYANILTAKLPVHTLAYAEQAEHKNAHYLKAYQLYEQIRQQNNWLTFDDQLLLAWEALERFEAIRAWAKNSFDYLLIDEFQDVNKVQVQIADILSEDHRNYMAIGDDDQCIYEWRGADVSYILNFKRRYQAKEFIISDNFRCPAEATLLAGKVIAQNSQRQLKDLVSQRGFGGQVNLKGFHHDGGIAHYIVEHYKTLLQQGVSAKDCIVLVRSYSQTAVIEARLIDEALPYQVIGNVRFYERPEVKALFTYLSFARQERDFQQNQQQNSQQTARPVSEQYLRRFMEILRNPNRYLPQQWMMEFVEKGRQHGGSLVDYLAQQLPALAQETSRKKLQKLVDILRQLQHKLDEDAGETLSWLVTQLEYLEALQKAAAVPELGEERCQNVRALVNYAQKKGTVLQFLAHLRTLHLEDEQADHKVPRLHIMSIHRSKGLEWPVVFVPCCGYEQLPSLYNDNIEEERRLLYVAMTRCQQQLHLLYAPSTGMTRFLKAVNAPDILSTAYQLQKLFSADYQTQLQANDLITLAQAIKIYPLRRYLEYWWRVPASTQHLWLEKIQQTLNQQTPTQQPLMDAQQSQLVSLTQTQLAIKSMERRLLLFAKRPVVVTLHQPAPEHGFAEQSFYFQLQQGTAKIAVCLAGGRYIGMVDSKNSTFPLQEVIDWSWLTATIMAGFQCSGTRRSLKLCLQLRPNISTKLTQAQHDSQQLTEQTNYLASSVFEDMAVLQAILAGCNR